MLAALLCVGQDAACAWSVEASGMAPGAKENVAVPRQRLYSRKVEDGRAKERICASQPAAVR